MTLDEFVASLERVPELKLLGGRANFHYKDQRFLHLHDAPDGTYADVRLGATWEEFPLTSAIERLSLLSLVLDHVERLRVHQR